MNTRFWGPSSWKFLHTITNIYPDDPTITDKLLMRDFMTLIPDVLPCKYCRASFTKYSASLNITPFLETNLGMQTWLYRMHNKVNAKLRRQGFCHIDNPTLDTVIAKYNSIADELPDDIPARINAICTLGMDFLGSIIYNYQGYFANCHTNEEKTKIIMVYHKFFNIIGPMIKQFSQSSKSSNGKSINKVYNYNIRQILQRAEPYSHLKTWFWECETLCDHQKHFKTLEKMDTHFNAHIVATCNNTDADKIQSCRKLSKRDRQSIKRITRKNNHSK